MENASNALIMAASILLGVMIISVGVVLFNIFSGYSSNAQEELSIVQDSEFNDRFLRFVSYIDDDMTAKEMEAKRVLLTAHDIITISNYAKENNTNLGFYDENNGYTDRDRASDSTRYIQIDVLNKEGNKVKLYTNFENNSNDNYIQFIENNSIIQSVDSATGNLTANTKYYVCTIENVRISTETNRIKYMRITPFN